MPPTHPRLILHGGAGHITRANLPPSAYALYASFLLSVNRSTRKLLEKGASALDAAAHAVALLEDNELFNCGRGAVFTREGGIELEASVSEILGAVFDLGSGVFLGFWGDSSELFLILLYW